MGSYASWFGDTARWPNDATPIDVCNYVSLPKEPENRAHD
jgi:hypothetical protein